MSDYSELNFGNDSHFYNGHDGVSEYNNLVKIHCKYKDLLKKYNKLKEDYDYLKKHYQIIMEGKDV